MKYRNSDIVKLPHLNEMVNKQFYSRLFLTAGAVAALFGANFALAETAEWEKGWKRHFTVLVEETAGLARQNQPIEVELHFEPMTPARLKKELRVANANSQEVPAQAFAVVRKNNGVTARIVFLANLKANETQSYRVYYDNPKAVEPVYDTGLTTAPVTGFEKVEPPRPFGLTVRNEHLRVDLHPRSGQIGKLAFLKGTGKLLTFAGGDRDTKIHWNPDLRNRKRLFQPPKLKGKRGWEYIHYWDPPPHFVVEKGPVMVRVKRWGPFTHNKEVFCSVEYRILAHHPYIIVDTELRMLEDYELEFLRDDEFGFKFGFNQAMWKDKSGKVRGWDLLKTLPIGTQVHGTTIEAHGIIPLEPDGPWISFYHDQTGDGVAIIHTAYRNTAVGRVKMDPPMSFIHVKGAAYNYWGRFLAGKLHKMPQARLPKGCEWKTQSVLLFHRFKGQGEPETLNRYDRILRHPPRVTIRKQAK